MKNSNKENYDLVMIDEPLTEGNLDLIGDAKIISITGEELSSKLLEKVKAAGVKMICMRIVGTDKVDIEYASKAGIRIANVPNYSPYAVAEHTLALILALNRKLIRANYKVREYDFTLDDLVGFDLKGKTIGIVGMGRIGSVLTKILHGLGCNIVAYNRSQNQELIDLYGLKYDSLENLCRAADIISIHMPLNKDTKYLINKSNIGLMKKGVMIVNTSRGSILNIYDVIDAIVDEKIGFLGLDVYENEHGLFFRDHSNDILKDETFARLLSFKNVLITGHQAFLTREALEDIAEATMQNILLYMTNKKNPNELW